MNFLDIILLIIISIFAISGIVCLVSGIVNNDICVGIGCLLGMLFFASLFSLPFVVLDRGSGSTIGTITSVDKNFFGTTALYIKTSETTQEKYCIEFNEELEEQAKGLIGKKVKISYGARVGFYSTGKCSQAPVEDIQFIEE